MTKTMTEKDMFLGAFEREYQTTLKVLRAYPPEKSELKPTEKMKNARELAWMLVLNQMVVVPTMAGDLKPGGLPGAPEKWSDVLAAFEREHKASMGKLETLNEEQLGRTMKMPIGPGQMGDMRIGDALWFFLSDTVHHRGQFTVYLRMTGAMLPSVYGPTADEKWF
ncbi:MAG: hypothetical protein E6K80_07555 [Candidatus Eisenbacteria bacterium]|uniref:DinB family protein n=1 Tax=Eiseniibacteriota bacterium TaxID=2212470 RepID=A0A538U4F3_UNCEI|nr:MAG: hypothetical protein E6K80_07555 [Candidatus Eisenbacteria bacterium]